MPDKPIPKVLAVIKWMIYLTISATDMPEVIFAKAAMTFDLEKIDYY